MNTKINGPKLLASIRRYCRHAAAENGWSPTYAGYAANWCWFGAKRAVWSMVRDGKSIRNPQRFAENAARRSLRRDATGRLVIPYWPGVLADRTGMPKGSF